MAKSKKLTPEFIDLEKRIAANGHNLSFASRKRGMWAEAALNNCYGDQVGIFASVESLEAAFDKSEAYMRQCWSTPDNLFDPLHFEFGFHLDCAANKHNHRLPNYLTEKMDALSLSTPWVGYKCSKPSVLATRLFLNPGFSNVLPWATRMHSEIQKSKAAVGAMIALCAPSSKWWDFCYDNASEIRLLGSRPQYVPPPGIKPSSNSRENVVVIFRHNANLQGGHAKITTWDWKHAPTGK